MKREQNITYTKYSAVKHFSTTGNTTLVCYIVYLLFLASSSIETFSTVCGIERYQSLSPGQASLYRIGTVRQDMTLTPYTGITIQNVHLQWNWNSEAG